MLFTKVMRVMPKVGTKMVVSSGRNLRQARLIERIRLEVVGIRTIRIPRQSFMCVGLLMKPANKI